MRSVCIQLNSALLSGSHIRMLLVNLVRLGAHTLFLNGIYPMENNKKWTVMVLVLCVTSIIRDHGMFVDLAT